MKLDVIARVIGSCLVIISYFVILHISASIGAIMMFIADAIRTRSWDVVLMLSFLLCISFSKLFV